MTTYRFYEDNGHGWLRVTLSELLALGIADQISYYSYIKPSKDGKTIYCYLEEDCDYTRFALAKDATGVKWSTRTYGSDRSSIRNYDSYSTVLKQLRGVSA